MEKKNKQLVAFGVVIAIVVFLAGAFVGSVITNSSSAPIKITGDNLEFVGKEGKAYTYKVCGCQEGTTCNGSTCGGTCPSRNLSGCGCSQ